MHTIPAAEIKRRGVIALEEQVKKGPVHIVKNNRPMCVVLSEEDYQVLVKQASVATATTSLWDLLSHRPWQGKRTRKDIDQQIKKERQSWRD